MPFNWKRKDSLRSLLWDGFWMIVLGAIVVTGAFYIVEVILPSLGYK